MIDSALLTSLFAQEDLLFLGIVSPDVYRDFKRYQDWLGEKRQGAMAYLEKNAECRGNLNKVLEGVTSVLVFALPYQDDLEDTPFQIARYARFNDYHDLMRERCQRVVLQLSQHFPQGEGAWRVTVDSVPILERALASKTVEGFIGKNTCYIHPKHGSFLLLGEVLTTHSLPFEEATQKEDCGTCTLCQVECPTGALDKDYQIDARKCLAYWTIENRGPIPKEYWPYLKDYVFGCDICQTVCPYNKESSARLPKSIPKRNYPDLATVAVMNEGEYEKYFGGTPLTRAKKEGLQRNALIALYVSNDPRLPEVLKVLEKTSSTLLQETISAF